MGCAVCLQDGCTALFTAAERGYDKVVKVLLDGGANPDIPDKVDTQMLLLLFEMDEMHSSFSLINSSKFSKQDKFLFKPGLK